MKVELIPCLKDRDFVCDNFELGFGFELAR
jgi:hypothetical protein